MSDMETPALEPLVKGDAYALTGAIQESWRNFVVSEINDHVVRLSVLQREFHWHWHDASDEMFLCLEGCLFVDLDDRTEELAPGQMITIPKGVRHRTRATERTLVLCFESKDNDVQGTTGT